MADNTDSTDIMGEYFEHMYSNKFETEVDKFLEKYNLIKLTQNLKLKLLQYLLQKFIFSFFVQNISTKKTRSSKDFPNEFYEMFKNNNYLTHLQLI